MSGSHLGSIGGSPGRRLSCLAAVAGLLTLGACESPTRPADPGSVPDATAPDPAFSTIPEGAYDFFQGFESDRSGWSDFGPGTLNREMSGYGNAGGYGDGIASAHGDHHARLRTGSCATDCAGPFTFWGGNASSTVPYITEVDIYLDVDWAGSNSDVRFDFSSAINWTVDGDHLKDVVFNAGTDPSGASRFVVSAGFNTGRANAFPSNPDHDPQLITQSGWYTFRHTFRDDAGDLVVDLEILDHSGNVVASWSLEPTFHDDAARFGTQVGERIPSSEVSSRYGWFANQEIEDLPIDQTGRLNGETPPPSDPQTKAECKKGGWEQFGFRNQGQCIRFVNTGKDSR